MATNAHVSSRLAPLLCVLVLGVALPSSTAAQQKGLSSEFRMGYATLGGDWGQVLNSGVDTELNIFYSLKNNLRLGAGLNLVSYGLEEQFHTDDVESGSQVGLNFGAMYPFQIGERFFPYIEAEFTWDRFRAEGRHEGFPPEEEDPEEGENTTPRYSGFGGSGSLGFLLRLSDTLYGDVSFRYGQFTTNEANLSYLDGPKVSSGTRSGIRFGLLWYLTGGS